MGVTSVEGVSGPGSSEGPLRGDINELYKTKLKDIGDVSDTDPSSGQLLGWDAAIKRWRPATPIIVNISPFDFDNLELAGNTISSTDTNGNIILAPNGSGKIILNSKGIEEGDSSANGEYSHSEGYGTADGFGSHAEGFSYTGSSAFYAHAEGYKTHADGNDSHAEGYKTYASDDYSHAEGYYTYANGKGSHTEGRNTTANERYSHAEGVSTVTNGYASHAEGYNTNTHGTDSHAEGYDTESYGKASHAEGHKSYSGGDYSHAEGSWTYTGDYASHAEGYKTYANGYVSHAEGYNTYANASMSHAGGFWSNATLHSQFARGSGRFAALGDAQYTVATLMGVQTSPAVSVILSPNNASATIALTANRTYSCLLNLAGRSAADAASFVRQFLVSDISATLSLIGSVQTVGTDILSGGATTETWDVTITIDTNKLSIVGSSDGSNTIHWVGKLEMTEVG